MRTITKLSTFSHDASGKLEATASGARIANTENTVQALLGSRKGKIVADCVITTAPIAFIRACSQHIVYSRCFM